MAHRGQKSPIAKAVTTVPSLVDFRAEQSPNNAWVRFPSAQDPGTFSSLSFLSSCAVIVHSLCGIVVLMPFIVDNVTM